MKDFKKTKKKYNILAVLLLILASIALVAGVSLDVLAEIDNTVAVILFVIALALVILIIPLLIFIAKYQGKISKAFVEELNYTVGDDFTYQDGEPILDIVEDSLHPYDKNMTAYSKDGIIGKYEDISFEYYICTLSKDSIFSNDNRTTYELYVFKNVSVFPSTFFVTAKKLKNVEQYKTTPTTGEATIYSLNDKDLVVESLPKDILFLSVNQTTLYVYKTSDRKKPLFQVAEDVADFKKLFDKEIEKIKETYEEAKVWIK